MNCLFSDIETHCNVNCLVSDIETRYEADSQKSTLEAMEGDDTCLTNMTQVTTQIVSHCVHVWGLSLIHI